jgi:aminoglycoside phosphotransferase (APT) family kinase protein
MKDRTKAHIVQYTEMARELIAFHYKKKSIRITPLEGGLTNFVFSARAGKEELVIRISEQREKINFFLKEQWAVARAKEKGIPVAEILEVGNDIIPRPYMISRRIEGEEATHNRDRFNIIGEIGRYAAIIHTIPTQGFGHMFNWSQNTLSKNNSWTEYLECEIKLTERLAIFEKHKMLPAKTITGIRKVYKQILKWNQSPCLHHGDLRLKNTLVNKEGKIVAIIDWEECISAIPPYWDLSIALHDLSLDAQWKFLEGYGLNGKQLMEIAPAMKVFNLLNYAPVIEQMVKDKQSAALDHYRARLHGALDMFSL